MRQGRCTRGTKTRRGASLVVWLLVFVSLDLDQPARALLVPGRNEPRGNHRAKRRRRSWPVALIPSFRATKETQDEKATPGSTPQSSESSPPSFTAIGINDSNVDGYINNPQTQAVQVETTTLVSSSSTTATSSRVCRVVTLSDGTIPATSLPTQLCQGSVLRQMDDLYHALAHQETRQLRYMEKQQWAREDHLRAVVYQPIPEDAATLDARSFFDEDDDDQDKLVQVVRNSLEDAGFELLQPRDLALCESLNAGYLLRLSIVPDLEDLDEGLWQEFYPTNTTAGNAKNANIAPVPLPPPLLDGKVLIFWRGYDTEVTRGRLVLAKLDYLQTKLVQSAAASLKARLSSMERGIRKASRRMARGSSTSQPNNEEDAAATATTSSVDVVDVDDEVDSKKEAAFSPLARYGGGDRRLDDPLEPFLIYEDERNEYCSVDDDGDMVQATAIDTMSPRDTPKNGAMNGEGTVSSEWASSPDHADNNFVASTVSVIPRNSTEATYAEDQEFYDCINHSPLQCPYDQGSERLPPMQLLRRVSMNNVVDLFSREGRRHLVSSLFAKTELVEPTYKEVVVIWRQKQIQPKRKLRLPQFVYDVADLFDIEGITPTPPVQPKRMPLEIRTFDGTPLANLPAVFPKTKLLFRPGDAFVFDLISIVSLGLVFSSSRFDNAKLDFLALVSAIVWLVRLAIRYSNKLARYDLLVKNFLTSKISHRNAGALKYLAAEAGTQRATRAALVHDWLCQQARSEKAADALLVDRILREGPAEVNELVSNKQVDVNMQAALNDLEDLNLLQIEVDGEGNRRVCVVCAGSSVEKRLRQAWNSIFRGGLSFRFLTGRR